MLDKNYLRAKMIEAGYDTIEKAGKAVGIPKVTMYRRMDSLNFTASELESMIVEFHIEDVRRLFTRLKR